MAEPVTAYRALADAGHRLNQACDLRDVCQRVVDIAAELFETDTAELYRHDPTRSTELSLVAKSGKQPNSESVVLGDGGGIVGWVARHSSASLISDTNADERSSPTAEWVRSEMAVPIAFDSDWTGVLAVRHRSRAAFDNTHLAILESFAEHAACAINTAFKRGASHKQTDPLSRPPDRFMLIHRIGRTFIGNIGLKDAMQRVLEMIASSLDCNMAAVLILDAELNELYAMSQYGTTQELRAPVSQGAAGYAVRHVEPVNIPNVAADPRYLRPVGRGQSELALPITLRDEVIGVLDIESPAPSAFDDADVLLLSAAASHAAVAIGASRHRADAERRLMKLDDRTRRLDLLNRVARSLTRRMGIDELLDEILELCAEAFDLRHCAIMLVDPQDRTSLVRCATIGYDGNAPARVAMGEGVTGHAARAGVPIYVPDVTKDPRYIAGASGGRAEMAAPLKVFDEVIGVIDAESTELEGFDEEDLDLFTSFAAQVAVAIRSAELTAKTPLGAGD